jgi:uncharacterized membrane protein
VPAVDWDCVPKRDDLRKPVFLMGYALAFSRRLRRNYIWMFLILVSREVTPAVLIV